MHLAALLAAFGEPLSPLGSAGPIRPVVLRAVLDREASRWPQQLQAGEERLIEGTVVLRRCVATAAVSSPAEEKPAAAMLAAVPDLSLDGEAGRRRALARWLHWLNPGGTTGTRSVPTRWPTSCSLTWMCYPSWS